MVRLEAGCLVGSYFIMECCGLLMVKGKRLLWLGKTLFSVPGMLCGGKNERFPYYDWLGNAFSGRFYLFFMALVHSFLLPERFPLLFGVSFAAVELVSWSFIAGYNLFVLLTLCAFLKLRTFLITRKSLVLMWMGFCMFFASLCFELAIFISITAILFLFFF